MKKSIKMLTAAALAAAMTATMAVSAFADGAELNITYQYGLAYTPAVIAMDQGLIEAAYKEATGEDLTVNWTQMNNGSDINTAFAAGEIDAGFLALGPIVSGVSKGIGYKIFSNSSGQPHALMTNDPDVKELKDLIGTDTFEDNQVKLRKGSIYRCAQQGGFGILDEINMAKNDAVSVLHATLDYRRSIDVPGYDKIDLHPAARFIGTMNYGYAGTRELNEALVSRFMVIDMPPQNEETLGFIFREMFPDAKKNAVEQFIGLFLDLQLKTANSEISTKSLDLRGLLGAMKIIKTGLSPWQAVQMGIVNKTFDIFEKEIVEDVVNTRIPRDWTKEDVYE